MGGVVWENVRSRGFFWAWHGVFCLWGVFWEVSGRFRRPSRPVDVDSRSGWGNGVGGVS